MKKFGFKNFRKFEEFPSIDLGGINIFVGKNNSGKSTAIKALMLTLLNAKNDKFPYIKYESEKSMLPPFLHSFYFSFEILEHLYLGNFNSAINFNAKNREITITFVNGDTFFSYTFTAEEKRPRVTMLSSEVSNKKLGIRYLYKFDRISGFGISRQGTVTCKFSVPEQELPMFRDNVEEQIHKYQIMLDGGDYQNGKVARELEQYQGCLESLENGNPECVLKYEFFMSNIGHGLKGTPFNNYLKQFFEKRNKEIIKDFKTIASLNYIETHDASHKLILDKEDKNNYLAQTIDLFLPKFGSFHGSGLMERWIEEFEIGKTLEVDDICGEAYRINVVEADGRRVPLAHKGTGTIQLVILLMRLAIAEHNASFDYARNHQKRMVFIEEPEQNMHPSLQSKLADLFYDVWKESQGSLQLVIETHSEYLVRRLQVLAAKTINSGELYPHEVNDEIKVFYFPEHGLPYSMGFKPSGIFNNDFGEGFFDEAGRSYQSLIKIEGGVND